MGRIRDRMSPLLLRTQGPHGLDLALRYIESADPRDLVAIQNPKVPGNWPTWIRLEMNPPPRLDEEDRRASICWPPRKIIRTCCTGSPRPWRSRRQMRIFSACCAAS